MGCRMNSAITPLHVRSGYSLLRGPASLDRLIDAARSLGHARLALSDVNGLYGATFFWRQAVQAGIEPIIGAELLEGSRSVVALVDSDTGYENLCRIITRIHGRLSDDRVAGSVRALAGDVAELSAGLQFVVEDDALAEAMLTAGVGSDRLWLGIDPDTQARPQPACLADCSRRLGLPLVATGKALLACPQDAAAARLLACIRTGSTYDAPPSGELPHPQALLRSGERIRKRLGAFPDAISNNRRLAERCGEFRLLPRLPVFPKFDCPRSLSAAAYLRQLCGHGLRWRYGRAVPDGACARLDQELRLIERKGFCEYFLVVWDIAKYARRQQAPVAGRGSGASSLVAYLLGITNVCPLAYGISFERFLNEQREDFPDLDLDFCWRIRDDVIRYAFDRWGDDHVAMVCTHNTFQPASALRETAKVFGWSNEQVSALRGDERRDDVRRIAAFSRRLLGLPHNLSVHPGGIVIAPRPIDRYVPIQRAAKGVRITQYDKDGIEDIRLVKLDLLGNRNLSTIRYACGMIHSRGGGRVEIDSIPADDPATIRLLRSGETLGCNQLESPAMRHLLQAMQPTCVRDVMKALALIRPGAASIGMKEVFIRRHRGLDPVPQAHPRVGAVLADTHGVMLYEDDVMLVAAAMLGGSLAQADRFRKAVQKCRTDAQRLELSCEFLAGCRKNGIDMDYAKSMWVQMAKFNAYSFCRAHAASYGVLAYAGAYLRAHYPLEFFVAALNNNQSMYPVRVYVEQAKRAGVRFLLPDINRSDEEFSIDPAQGDAVRVGFNRVSGIGPAGIASIVEARQREDFQGLADCLRRTHLGEQELRSLILCGAFDSFGRNRPTLMLELNLLLNDRPDPWGNQEMLLRVAPNVDGLPDDFEAMRKYLDERRILGLSVREHIMAIHRAYLAGRVDADSRVLRERLGKRVRIAGVLEAQRTAPTRRGERMMFLTLDDEFGLFEVTVFPSVLPGASSLKHYGPYIVTGRVEDQYGAISLTAESILDVSRPTGNHAAGTKASANVIPDGHASYTVTT